MIKKIINIISMKMYKIGFDHGINLSTVSYKKGYEEGRRAGRLEVLNENLIRLEKGI